MNRTLTLSLALCIAACVPSGAVDDDVRTPGPSTPEDVAPPGGTDPTPPGGDDPDPVGDDGDIQAPIDPDACAPRVDVIPGVVATGVDVDTCCGGGFDAMVDGSGLTTPNEVTLHDCTDANRYGSAPNELSGTLQFDLGSTYRVDAVTIWNSGQASGQRGVREVVLSGSVDGVTFAPIPGGPVELERPRCPSLPETFSLHGVPARYLRLEVISTYGEGGVSTFGIGEIQFSGVPDCDLEEVSGIVATSDDLGACCGGSLAALTDASGLDVDGPDGLHTCSDAEGWKSTAGVTQGDLILDLGATERVAEIAVWNSAQAGGDRGVRGLVIAASNDGVDYTVIDGLPPALRAERACPAEAQFLHVDPPVEARFLRFEIDGKHGDGSNNVGMGEVKVYAEAN